MTDLQSNSENVKSPISDRSCLTEDRDSSPHCASCLRGGPANARPEYRPKSSRAPGLRTQFSRSFEKKSGCGCVTIAVIGFAPAANAQQKVLKVYVGTGFDGNTWMNASTNLLRAIAKTKAYKD